MKNRLSQNSDDIWKALADGTRRDMLDQLAECPLTTGDLVERFGDRLCRTAVMKHLAVLVDANLVIVRREGRIRWNYINPVPIQHVCDRWVNNHVKHMASALSRLKDFVEVQELQACSKIDAQPKPKTASGKKSK